jgi:hypothetical protein
MPEEHRKNGTVPALRSSVTGYDPACRPAGLPESGGDDRFVDAYGGIAYFLEAAKDWLARDLPGYRIPDVDSFLDGVLAELRGGVLPSAAD